MRRRLHERHEEGLIHTFHQGDMSGLQSRLATRAPCSDVGSRNVPAREHWPESWRRPQEVTYWRAEHWQLGKLRLVKPEMPARMRALSFERGELVASRCGQLHLPSLSSCCEVLGTSASCGWGRKLKQVRLSSQLCPGRCRCMRGSSRKLEQVRLPADL